RRDAGGRHGPSLRNDAGGQPRLHGRAGFPRVAPDQHPQGPAGRLARLHQDRADPSHRRGIERVLPCLAANSIRSEKTHGFTGAIVTVTVAVCGARTRIEESTTPTVTISVTVRDCPAMETGSVRSEEH